MPWVKASVERSRSVSSTRSRKSPPVWRLYRKLNSAVRAPPICNWPVGLGAKRVRTLVGAAAWGDVSDMKGDVEQIAAERNHRARQNAGNAPPFTEY